jgi:hypothetical protein
MVDGLRAPNLGGRRKVLPRDSCASSEDDDSEEVDPSEEITVLVLKADVPPFSAVTTGLTCFVRGDGGRKCRVLCVTVVVEGVLDKLGA